VIPLGLRGNWLKGLPTPDFKTTCGALLAGTEQLRVSVCPERPIVKALDYYLAALFELVGCRDFHCLRLGISCNIQAIGLFSVPIVHFKFNSHFELVNWVDDLIVVQLFQVKNALPWKTLLRFITHPDNVVLILIIWCIWDLGQFPINVSRHTKFVILVFHEAPFAVIGVYFGLVYLDFALLELILYNVRLSCTDKCNKEDAQH